jgi:hypothetical protein
MLERKIDKEGKRRRKILEDQPEYYALGCEVETACWRDKENKRYQKKRKK